MMPAARSTLSRLDLQYPPLPQTLMEAMKMLNQPDRLEVKPITRLVERDPIVVARLLQIVNSAYYGLRRTVNNVERAVVLLGPVSVAGIVVGMHMLRLRATLPSAATACFNRLIQHCQATAFLTRHLLETLSTRRSGHASVGFTAGLLHDFGKIILIYNFPTEAVDFYEQQRLEGTVRANDERHLEQLLFGFDHTEAGEYVARKLNFPDVLVDVIRYHHIPNQTPAISEAYMLTPAVAVADLVARTMGYAFTRPLTPEQCLQSSAWKLLLERFQPTEWTPNSLLAHLHEQQEHLDHHVQHMSVPNSLKHNRRLP